MLVVLVVLVVLVFLVFAPPRSLAFALTRLLARGAPSLRAAFGAGQATRASGCVIASSLRFPRRGSVLLDVRT